MQKAPLDLGVVLAALSDPHRRRVIAELSVAPEGTERTCVSFGLPVSKATLTHHFRILREAGLISQVDRGNSRAAALCRHEIEAALPGLLALIVKDANGNNPSVP
jgi:DNA-binding transcriptional ArsR family regulator